MCSWLCCPRPPGELLLPPSAVGQAGPGSRPWGPPLAEAVPVTCRGSASFPSSLFGLGFKAGGKPPGFGLLRLPQLRLKSFSSSVSKTRSLIPACKDFTFNFLLFSPSPLGSMHFPFGSQTEPRRGGWFGGSLVSKDGAEEVFGLWRSVWADGGRTPTATNPPVLVFQTPLLDAESSLDYGHSVTQVGGQRKPPAMGVWGGGRGRNMP